MFFSPTLSDPLFLLQWQLHVVVVSLFAIFGIWAGTTRRPWYVPATLLVALLWLFVPLEAPEPAALLFAGTLGVATACRLLRPWGLIVLGTRRTEKTAAAATLPVGSVWRFKLSDALWMTFIAAIGTRLVVKLYPFRWNQSIDDLCGRFAGSDMALSGLCLILLAVMTAATYWQPGWRRKGLAALVLSSASVVTTTAHGLWLKMDFLLINSWPLYLERSLGMSSGEIDPIEILAVYLLTMIEFVAIVAIGLLLLWPSTIIRAVWFRVGQQAACGIVLLVLVVGAGSIYAKMVDRPQWPDETAPSNNRIDQLSKILDEQTIINTNHYTVQELKSSGKAKASKRLSELFDELDALLRQKDVIYFALPIDQPNQPPFGSVLGAHDLAHTLLRQADAEWKGGERAEAIRHEMLSLRLGANYQRRGLVQHTLSGHMIEATTLATLCAIRSELDCDDARDLQNLLREIDAQREPVSLVLERDRASKDRENPWRDRLQEVIGRLTYREEWDSTIVVQILERRDATLALLHTDLAIRCFRERNNRWPTDLQELASPAQMSIDPYSGKRLVYRVVGDQFLLYSVGPDRRDDGGNFGVPPDVFRISGYDLDLDIQTRRAAAAASDTSEPAPAASDASEAVTHDAAD